MRGSMQIETAFVLGKVKIIAELDCFLEEWVNSKLPEAEVLDHGINGFHLSNYTSGWINQAPRCENLKFSEG